MARNIHIVSGIIFLLAVAMAGCGGSDKNQDSSDSDSMPVFTFEEDTGSAVIDSTRFKYMKRDTKLTVKEKFKPLYKRTKQRLDSANVMFWDLEDVVLGVPVFYMGENYKSDKDYPAYFHNLFRQAGYRGDPDLDAVISAMKAGDKNAFRLMERLVLYSYELAHEISGVEVGAVSYKKSAVIFYSDMDDTINLLSYHDFINNILFGKVLVEGYMRMISDGNLSLETIYEDSPESKYIERIFDNTYDKHFGKNIKLKSLK